jgi:hypothetical protein
MFFWFRIFLTWQFLLGKKWKNNANSKKNVNNKKLAKTLGSEIRENIMLILMNNFF